MTEDKNIIIDIHNLDVVAKCKMFSYGEVYDSCNNFNAKLVGGNVYAIVGEFGSGGWAISYTLTGYKGKYDSRSNENIRVNNRILTDAELKRISWSVGEVKESKKYFGLKYMTVMEQLQRAAKKYNGVNIDKIIDEFELARERVDRPLTRLSGERWSASMAIGYAMKKKIYCFSWLNTQLINQLRYRLKTCFEILKKDGAIIILPTSNAEAVADIVDVIIDMGKFNKWE